MDEPGTNAGTGRRRGPRADDGDRPREDPSPDVTVALTDADRPGGGGTVVSVTRRAVLEHLAAASDAERRETTTVGTLARVFDADRLEIEAHLYGLAACELARIHPNGRVRVTVTGEEFLELGTDGPVVLDPSSIPPDE